MKKQLLTITVLIIVLGSGCLGMNADQVIAKFEKQQRKIKTMETLMTSSIKIPLFQREMVQKVLYYMKGTDRLRLEMLEPMQQTTIYNGDYIYIIKADGTRTTMPSSKEGQGKTHIELKDYYDKFSLKLIEKKDHYLLTGKAKDDSISDTFGSIELVVQKDTYLPTQMTIFKKDSSLLITSTMKYTYINNIPVLSYVHSKSNMQIHEMDITVTYSNIMINHELSDELFHI